MAISQGMTDGFNTTNQAGSHAVMVALRDRLLAVGLTQVEVEDGYDASPSGDASQVPSQPGNSPRLVFSFSDARQVNEPIYIIFSVWHGSYYNTNSGNYRNRIRVELAKEIDSNGAPVGATIIGGTPGSTGNSSISDRHVVNNSGESVGDFVRYAGDSLTVIMAADGIAYFTNTSIAHYLMPYVYLHVERLPAGEFAALVQTSGNAKVEQTIQYTAGSVFSRADLQDRAGGPFNLYEGSTPLVAAIYAPVVSGGVKPLKRVFTCPTLSALQCSKPVLNFAGEERPYLQFLPGGMLPRWENTCWLFEWE